MNRWRKTWPWLATGAAALAYAVSLSGAFGYSVEQRPLPALTASPLAGGAPVTDANLRGEPTILNVWAPSCAPCLRELPALDQLAKEYDGRVRFLGLVSWGTPAEADAVAKRKGITHLPLLAGGADFLSTLDVQSVPTTFFIRADGTLVGRQVGMRGEGFFRAQADKLLSGKL